MQGSYINCDAEIKSDANFEWKFTNLILRFSTNFEIFEIFNQFRNFLKK